MTKTKVALVDDDEDLRLVMSTYLETDGYEVLQAGTGSELKALLNKEEPDIILLDLMLAGEDGLALIPQIKQKISAPIIVVSGKTDTTDRVVGLELGADDYITKPIKPKILLSKVKSLLRRISLDQVEIIEIGNLIIDRSSYKASCKGKEINLPRKEFELLYLLASKPGKVFKRDYILESVWGRDVVVGDRTIDVHIRKLREKIGDNFFKTVKGVGYKFVV